MKNKILIIIALIAAFFALISGVMLLIIKKDDIKDIKINLITTSYEIDNKKQDLKVYTKEDFGSFFSAYHNNKLPEVYITEFLFDGIGMYKPYDLDDFIDNGNIEVEALSSSVLNINTLGNVELKGDFTGMIAVNTNDKKGDINIILNGVNINTNSSKIPAIYVYNKDITYLDVVVTIKTVENTKNYIEGGNLKKVSLIPSDNLEEYISKYNGNNKIYYNTYTNYYGVYTSTQIDKILFAKVTANNDDLDDGDPYYFYKASGAISSDIDLFFEGKGYLSIISKNKEGVETKGNLTFSGKTGDYYIESQDNSLNTTTSNKEQANARNNIIIDVNSLYAATSNDIDYGAAIDSNGDLIINGGLVVAISNPGQDTMLDIESGIYINGGTFLAIGDMYDQISSNSKQKFIVLSFSDKPIKDDIISMLDSNNNHLFSYKTDRTYSNLIYSSSSINEGVYYLYKNSTITGEEKNGYYISINSYDKGAILGYNSKGRIIETPNNMIKNDNNIATNKIFTIDSISNIFGGIANYSE